MESGSVPRQKKKKNKKTKLKSFIFEGKKYLLGYILDNAWSWKAETMILTVFQKELCNCKSCRFLNWCSKDLCSCKGGRRIKYWNNFNLWNNSFSFIKCCLRIPWIFLYFQDYVMSGTGRYQCSELKKCIKISRRCWLPLILKCINKGSAYAKIFYFSDAVRTFSRLYYKAYI